MPGPFSDHEVHQGWVYAMTNRPRDNFVGIVADKDLLRAIANETDKRRKPGVLLPALAGVVCREYLRQRDLREKNTYEAYLCGVMKMFAGRSARSSHAKAVRKRLCTPSKQPAEKYAELPSGQFLLPLPHPRG